LDIVTKEMDKLRSRYILQYITIPTEKKLTDKKVDEILETEKKAFRN
jgi:hypothetical protein